MYQHCRWYDPYPGLAFVLKLLQLMPRDQQAMMGQRLNRYLDYRSIPKQSPCQYAGHRWYDDVPVLVAGLERLKRSPQPVIHQSTDFLLKQIEENQFSVRCA